MCASALADGGTTDGNSTITVSDGYFTNDPTEFLATGKAAVTSDKDGYNYMVDDASEDAATVVETGEADVAEVPSTITDEADKELAKSVKETLEATVPSVEGDGLTAAANTVANENTVTVAEGTEALEAAGVVTTDETVTIVVQPYMAMEITAANAEANTFTLNITQMYRTIATTADVANGDIILDAADGTVNAVEIGNAKSLPVDKAVTVTIPVPDTIAGAAENNTLYVTHKNYVYTGTVGGTTGSYTLSFTNPHGFSEFTVSATNGAVAQIGDVSYTTLQAAVDEVAKGQTITLLADGLKATVSKEVTFKVAGEFTATITAGSGYKLSRGENGEYIVTESVVIDDGDSGSSGSSGSTTYAVSVNTATNGTVSVSPRNASKGATVTITVTPNEGYVLGTLTATDANGDTISLSNEGDGKYTFTMPSSKVIISATFVAESEPGHPDALHRCGIQRVVL